MNATTANAADGRTVGPDPRPAVSAELLDVGAVAAMLNCSRRHVYRLADGGRLPRPVKLGQLVRWRRAELLQWLDEGCPAVRSARGGDSMTEGRHEPRVADTATGLFELAGERVD